MVKQSKPNTATEWLKRQLYGNDWGVHSPEIIKSPFDSIMESYRRMALLHRQINLEGGCHPEVYLNEHGEIIRVKEARYGSGKTMKYWGGKKFEDWYRDMGFFFEGERY